MDSKVLGGSSCQWEKIAVHKQPRSMHGAVVKHGSMLVAGGCHREKYMNDVLELDLTSLKWSTREPLPVSCAGHQLVATESSIFAFVGIPTDKHLRVYEFDSSWSLVPTHGHCPVATMGHSATMVENSVLVFGGKDFDGEMTCDLHSLNLETKLWERVDASGTIPPPLSFHGAALHSGRLLVFGGGSVSNMFSFDLHRKEWVRSTQGGALPQGNFGCASAEDRCYAVGGSIPQTLALAKSTGTEGTLEQFDWQVIAEEPDMQLEGLSLVLQGRSTLIAAGMDSHGKEFCVFRMEAGSAVKRIEKTEPGLHCRVRESDGTHLDSFHVPKQGKHVAEILQVIEMQSKVKGYVRRGGFSLTTSDLVVPGDELVFHRQPTVLLPQVLSSMDVSACRDFLMRMDVSLVSGVGWLMPRKVVQAEAFQWYITETLEHQLKEQVEYIQQHTRDTTRVEGQAMDFDRNYTVNKKCRIQSLAAGYSLEFNVPVQLNLMCTGTATVGFAMEERLQQETWWQSMVMLLGLSIKCPEARPWIVVSDLKEEWHFAWMDGRSMFCSRADSREQGLGILRDLVRDFDKVSWEEIGGSLSKLPYIFDRKVLNVPCDSPDTRPILFKKVPREGGGINIYYAHRERTGVFSSMLESDMEYFSDEDEKTDSRVLLGGKRRRLSDVDVDEN